MKESHSSFRQNEMSRLNNPFTGDRSNFCRGPMSHQFGRTATTARFCIPLWLALLFQAMQGFA